jgi:hypothetical protein
VLHEVDETLRGIVKRDVINGSDVEVVFDAPTKDWASRRNTPTIDIYLYDIREDLKRRQAGVIDVLDDEGRITGRRTMPRIFKLSYLVTAWTQRAEDEHRLLSSMLACFLRHDRIPVDWLTGSLQDNGWPLDTTIALPPPEDRALSDVWSALGGELKPSLDLVVTTPIDVARFVEAATLVDAPPRFNWDGAGGPPESVQRTAGSDGNPEVARVGRLEPTITETVPNGASSNGGGGKAKGKG